MRDPADAEYFSQSSPPLTVSKRTTSMVVPHHIGRNKLPRRVLRSFPDVPKRRVHHDVPTIPRHHVCFAFVYPIYCLRHSTVWLSNTMISRLFTLIATLQIFVTAQGQWILIQCQVYRDSGCSNPAKLISGLSAPPNFPHEEHASRCNQTLRPSPLIH